MAFVVTPGTNYSATSPVTSTNLNAHVSGLTIAGITNTQIDTAAASFVQINSGDSGVTATEGAALWNKTTDKFGVHDGTSWVNHRQGEALAGQPRLLNNYLWRDTTLGIERVYMSKNGTTGWHPLDEGYKLASNSSGGALAIGDVVIFDDTGSAVITTTTAKKDQRVAGVCVEAILNGATGIIATFGCPKHVLVNVDETDGVIAAGDGLVAYSTVKLARTTGAMPTTGFVTSQRRQRGTPLGCFAVSLSVVGGGQVTARMLPAVGQGCTVTMEQTALTAQTTVAGEYADQTVTPLSAKHSPIVDVELFINVSGDAGSAGDNYAVAIAVGETTGSGTNTFSLIGQGGASGLFAGGFRHRQATANDTTTPTTLGNKFAMATTLTAGGGSSVSTQAKVCGYTY